MVWWGVTVTKDARRDPETPARGDRLSRLSAASLLINASLDVDTVPQEVLDSARALTKARYGAFIPLDNTGQIEDFLSPGLSPDGKAAPPPHHAPAATFAC